MYYHSAFKILQDRHCSITIRALLQMRKLGVREVNLLPSHHLSLRRQRSLLGSVLPGGPTGLRTCSIQASSLIRSPLIFLCHQQGLIPPISAILLTPILEMTIAVNGHLHYPVSPI